MCQYNKAIKRPWPNCSINSIWQSSTCDKRDSTLISSKSLSFSLALSAAAAVRKIMLHNLQFRQISCPCGSHKKPGHMCLTSEWVSDEKVERKHKYWIRKCIHRDDVMKKSKSRAMCVPYAAYGWWNCLLLSPYDDDDDVTKMYFSPSPACTTFRTYEVAVILTNENENGRKPPRKKRRRGY